MPEVVFCFDGDEAGRKAAWRALESTLPAMQDGKGATFLFLPAGEDPDSLVRKEGTARFLDRVENEAEPLADFLFRHLGEGLKLDSMEGRSRIAMLAKPLIATLPDGLYREMLLGKLAEITRLEKETLRAAVLDTPPIPATRSEAPAASPIPLTSSPRLEPRQRQQRINARASASSQLVNLPDQAVRLLLQNPQQPHPSSEELMSLSQAPDSLLVQLIRLLEENPGMSTPALLGAWHGTEQGEALTALAANEFLTPQTTIDVELGGIIAKIRAEHERTRINFADGEALRALYKPAPK